MAATIGRLVETYEEPIYALIRILIGLLFMQHGAQKLFGLFGGVDGSGGSVSLVSLYGVAGVVEFVGGLLIAVGLLTRLVALITTGQMVAAQVISHLPEGVIPIQNGGELSMLYIAAFLVLVIYGSGQYSFAQLVLNRELV